MRKYRSCKICNCSDCRLGNYRYGSWKCPIFKKQICDVCCIYDMDDQEFIFLSSIKNKRRLRVSVRDLCKAMKCIKYKKYFSNIRRKISYE